MPRGQTLLSAHTEIEAGRGRVDYYLLKKLQITPCFPSSLLSPSSEAVWSRRGLSACTDEAQDQSAGRATVPTALLPALPSCATLPHTCTLKCSHRHTFRELSLLHTHLHADKQADQAGTHPLPLSVWGAARGYIPLLSGSRSRSSSSSSRTDPEEREQSSPENTHQLLQLKASHHPSIFFSLFLFPFFRPDVTQCGWPSIIPLLCLFSSACASGTTMEDILTCSHATFSQVFGRQGHLMQASE